MNLLTVTWCPNLTVFFVFFFYYFSISVSLPRSAGIIPPGGYAAHSLAIMTDAAHLLSDFGSIMISIFSLWISSRPQTHAMTFGWHRAGEIRIIWSHSFKGVVQNFHMWSVCWFSRDEEIHIHLLYLCIKFEPGWGPSGFILRLFGTDVFFYIQHI